VLKLVFLIMALGLIAPFVVNHFKTRGLKENERAVMQLIRDFRAAQQKHFEEKKEYAQNLKALGGAFASLDADLDNPKSAGAHGYRFRILTAEKIVGGSRSYLDNGRMSGGYGLLAVPVSYGITGVDTFITSKDGIWVGDLGAGGEQHTKDLLFVEIPTPMAKIE
jgi:hypothetical protein